MILIIMLYTNQINLFKKTRGTLIHLLSEVSLMGKTHGKSLKSK